MRRIATPTELQNELQRLYEHTRTERPSRQFLANALQKLSERVQTKSAGSNLDGPSYEITDNDISVWFTSTSYGRVHHLTGDLTAAEDRLMKIRQVVLDELNEQGVINRPGDVVVDGRGPDKNTLVTYFFVAFRDASRTKFQLEELAVSLLVALKKAGMSISGSHGRLPL